MKSACFSDIHQCFLFFLTNCNISMYIQFCRNISPVCFWYFFLCFLIYTHFYFAHLVNVKVLEVPLYGIVGLHSTESEWRACLVCDVCGVWMINIISMGDVNALRNNSTLKAKDLYKIVRSFFCLCFFLYAGIQYGCSYVALILQGHSSSAECSTELWIYQIFNISIWM